MRKFTSGVAEKLGHYVYLLIDPRNGQTFYIGRGQGNRVFAHINEELKLADGEDELSAKLETIREIKRLGLDPVHVIQRHNMDGKMAKAVEAALIDYTPGLTNLVPGAGSDYGPANADELEDRYGRETMKPDPDHKLLYIKTHTGVAEERGSLYEAVRWAWKLGKSADRASRANYIIAVIQGVCRGVFVATEWKQFGSEGRWAFEGEEVFGGVADWYVGKLIPEDKRKPGAASPVQYGYN